MDVFLICPSQLELSVLEPIAKKMSVTAISCGVGPVASCHFVTRLLAEKANILIVLAGIGGLYPSHSSVKEEKFLAGKEFLADFGRCTMNSLKPIEIEGSVLQTTFPLNEYLNRFLSRTVLDEFLIVDMATVSCSSASQNRAKMIEDSLDGRVVVENMEGAAVALACQSFHAGLIEIRTISNMAGEPDKDKWNIEGAMNRLTQGVEILLSNLELI